MAGDPVKVPFVLLVVWLLPAKYKRLDPQELVQERFDRYMPKDLRIR